MAAADTHGKISASSSLMVSTRLDAQSSNTNRHCFKVKPAKLGHDGSLIRASNVLGIGPPFSTLGRLGFEKNTDVDRAPAWIYHRLGSPSTRAFLCKATEQLSLPQKRSAPSGALPSVIIIPQQFSFIINLIINLSFAYHSPEAIYTLVLGVGSPLLYKDFDSRISIAASSLSLPKARQQRPNLAMGKGKIEVGDTSVGEIGRTRI
jgi:hypothetical protein